ncbi:MAG TPA: LamG-like jellyroll fold domain-containing protein [Bryobacteraceae bacterium]|nr:LamG-like jellyroll fold domain-containing protein [Bryobacteraceae bacterium]
MKTIKSSKLVYRTTVCLSVACALLGFQTRAIATAPLYQWNFNSGDGSNTGTGTGGTLTQDVGITSGSTGYAAGSFVSGGISGTVGDNSFQLGNAWDNYYDGASYSPITNAAGISNIDLTGVTQFTITMWVKWNGGRGGDILDIGSSTTPDGTSNPGITIGMAPSWNNGIRVGINNHIQWTNDPWNSGTDRGWVFLAIAYNGNNGAYWGQSAMSALYGGGDNNAALITGGTNTSATVAQNFGIHDGSYWNSAGIPAVGSTATLFLGNNGTNSQGFDGNLDDVRIYNGLLSVSDIDAVRLEGLAVPEPSTAMMFIVGSAGAFVLIARRRGLVGHR